MDFQTFHKYNRLVRRGMEAPLRCSCTGPLVTMLDANTEEPILQCFMCGALTRPGLAMYDRVKEIVESYEH